MRNVQAKRPLLVLGLVAALFISGCSGSKGVPAAADPSSTVNATGDPVPDAATLTVTVVDDSVAPIEGADVGLNPVRLQAKTDALGSATFGNLPPGTYDVVAQRLDFARSAKRVVLGPNAQERVTLTLTSIPVPGVPFAEPKGPFDGYFDCRLGLLTQTGACGGVCPLVACVGPPEDAWPNDKSSFEFRMYNETTFIVGEMKWPQGSYATSQQLRNSFSYEGRSGSHWFCTATSGSPLKWVYSIEDGCQASSYCGIDASSTPGSSPSEPTTKLTLLTYTNTPFACEESSNLHPAELALQQHFDIFVTLFQNMEPAEGYTAFSDT